MSWSMLQQRKGEGSGEMVMVLWFFLLLALIAGCIALGLNIFFGAGYDVRAVEAALLHEQFATCIAEQGMVWEGDLLKACRISSHVMGNVSETWLGVLICEGNCESGKRMFQLGSNFEACGFTGKNEAYARCAQGLVLAGGQEYGLVTFSNQGVRRSA